MSGWGDKCRTVDDAKKYIVEAGEENFVDIYMTAVINAAGWAMLKRAEEKGELSEEEVKDLNSEDGYNQLDSALNLMQAVGAGPGMKVIQALIVLAETSRNQVIVSNN